MTATVAAPSKAARFADDAEALGWEVDRERLPEGGRLVRCSRGDELYELAWHRNTRGVLVYAYGIYSAPSVAATEVVNVKAALRDMALHRASNGARLPFDCETTTDVEVLKALAGREIEWCNSISGVTESGVLPRGGLHFTITGEGGCARVLNFPDQVHTGFRSVRLSSITKVI